MEKREKEREQSETCEEKEAFAGAAVGWRGRAHQLATDS